MIYVAINTVCQQKWLSRFPEQAVIPARGNLATWLILASVSNAKVTLGREHAEAFLLGNPSQACVNALTVINAQF